MKSCIFIITANAEKLKKRSWKVKMNSYLTMVFYISSKYYRHITSRGFRRGILYTLYSGWPNIIAYALFLPAGKSSSCWRGSYDMEAAATKPAQQVPIPNAGAARST
jgi:hypothetical protein